MAVDRIAWSPRWKCCCILRARLLLAWQPEEELQIADWGLKRQKSLAKISELRTRLAGLPRPVRVFSICDLRSAILLLRPRHGQRRSRRHPGRDRHPP